jgi:hypothetical protein
MNVQDVINAALQGARGRAVVEQRDEQPATDTDIMKLAAALNFIGTNLEDSVPTPEELYAQLELAQQYEKVAARPKLTDEEKASKREFDKRQRAADRLALKEYEADQMYRQVFGTSRAEYEAQEAPQIERNHAYAESLLRDKEQAQGALRAERARLLADLQQRSADNAISPAHVPRAPEPTTYATPSPDAKTPPRGSQQQALLLEHIQRGGLTPQQQRALELVAEQQQQRSAAGHVSHPTLTAGATGTVHAPPASSATDVAALLGSSKPAGGTAEVPASMSSGQSLAPEEKLKFMDRLKRYGESAGKFTGILDVEGRSGLNRAGRLAGTAGALGALGYGGYRLATRGDGQHQEQKTSALRYAAQVGKQRLLEKVAEDAINPAQISAGPAPAFSGEVMPASTPVFGGVSPEHLVALKAQKVRERINSEMRQYVSEVGDNYNLNGHLSIFNK